MTGRMRAARGVAAAFALAGLVLAALAASTVDTSAARGQAARAVAVSDLPAVSAQGRILKAGFPRWEPPDLAAVLPVLVLVTVAPLVLAAAARRDRAPLRPGPGPRSGRGPPGRSSTAPTAGRPDAPWAPLREISLRAG
jgi:hypothetical protein